MLKEKRQQIWDFINSRNIQICAVTKGKTLQDCQSLFDDLPHLSIIGENRWPDCEEKFRTLGKVERHFIGPLQSNKIKKVVELCDCIQSVESFEKAEKINAAAQSFGKEITIYLQVNISKDPKKSGLKRDEVFEIIEKIKNSKFSNLKLDGLMTIGEQVDLTERKKYFTDMKTLFDATGLRTLSMGMSSDYETAIECGSNMVRLGSILFD